MIEVMVVKRVEVTLGPVAVGSLRCGLVYGTVDGVQALRWGLFEVTHGAAPLECWDEMHWTVTDDAGVEARRQGEPIVWRLLGEDPRDYEPSVVFHAQAYGHGGSLPNEVLSLVDVAVVDYRLVKNRYGGLDMGWSDALLKARS